MDTDGSVRYQNVTYPKQWCASGVLDKEILMLYRQKGLAEQGAIEYGTYMSASNDGFAPVCGKDDDWSDGGFQGPVQVREAFDVQHVNLVNNYIIVFQGPDLGMSV